MFFAPSDALRREPATIWRRHAAFVLLLVVTLLTSIVSLSGRSFADEPRWPSNGAKRVLGIKKKTGMEITDLSWVHLHLGHHTAANSPENILHIEILESKYTPILLSESEIEVQYTIHGIPASDWLSPDSTTNIGFEFRLALDNPAIQALPDGFHDISVNVRGSKRMLYRPAPIFVHITRNNGPLSFQVPIISNPEFASDVTYVDYRRRNLVGYPADPSVQPWHIPPGEADLYAEVLGPTGAYYQWAQFWWKDPPHPRPEDPSFVRAMQPIHGQNYGGHNVLPFRDGPRGVGWMSAYVSGEIDSNGGFAFAEDGGPVRYLKPDGEIITVAGWTLKEGTDPVWIQKPLATIRSNQEIRGTWLNGTRVGFDEGQKDVTIDPKNQNIWYVASQTDHCIWKVEIQDLTTHRTVVSVLAGDPNHQSGFQDGPGHAARFNQPFSLVFDPVRDVMYVADKNNDAIRLVTREGVVTTLVGRPGMFQRVGERGVADPYYQIDAAQVSQINVSLSEAQSGLRPEIYHPQSIRVDSKGNIILLELGYGLIRRINPVTFETKTLGHVHQIHKEFYEGWAWLAVDRWGNSGPKDGIYWCVSVAADMDGAPGSNRYNEVFAWLAPEGGLSHPFSYESWAPFARGWGRGGQARFPHYPWLIAVDPRGALLMTGFGEHGITRVRKYQSGDPVPEAWHSPGFFNWRHLWDTGGDLATALGLTFGWDTHNYLGFQDGWGLTGNESDEQLFDLFQVPDQIRSNPELATWMLKYIRVSSGPQRDRNVQPTPTRTPTPTSTSTPVPPGSATPTPEPTKVGAPPPRPGATATPIVVNGNRQPLLRRVTRATVRAGTGTSVDLIATVRDDGRPGIAQQSSISKTKPSSKVTIVWRQVEGPANVLKKVRTTMVLRKGTPVRITRRVTPTIPGAYTFSVTANDGQLRNTLTFVVNVK